MSELTGLDKATVSTVVAALVGEGLLSRETMATGKPGRPEQALRIADDAGVLVGARVELGSVRLLAATLAGEPVATHELAIDRTPESAVHAVDEGVRALLTQADRTLDDVRAIGVGVPALFDRGGRLQHAPNLGWRDVPFGPELARRLDAPVYVDNDTKAAGLAETLFGRCDDLDDFVYIAGHSGIGGALYLGGRLYRGHDGFAGELGHLKVRPGGRTCGCGAKGCLEAYVSERALLDASRQAGLTLDTLDELVACDIAGDPRARSVLREAAEVLGDACADLVNLFNPQRIVLGGAFAIAAARMIDDLEARMDRQALAAPRSRCTVSLATFGVEAVTMGGVALALEGFLSLPGWLLSRQMHAR